MAETVNDVQSKVAGICDQDEDTDNISTADYSLRLGYINRREQQWAELGKWDVLLKEYNTIASTSTGNCSIALPEDFRRIASYPKITYDGTNTKLFTEVRTQEEGQFSASDRYVKVLGNPHSGYHMIVNPTTTTGRLASGASIKIPYYSTVTSLASPTNKIQCPNPDYIVQGVIADVWEAREDGRFERAKVEANIILQNMLESEFTPSEAAYGSEVKTVEQTKHGFRWGRD